MAALLCLAGMTAAGLFVSVFICPVYGQGAAPVDLNLTSTAFENGEYIPKDYSKEGLNISPPLRWQDPPPKTQSLALIVEDPDAPSGTFVHWVAWNINPATTELPEAMPNKGLMTNGIKQGTNDFNLLGYTGPMPPVGTDHRYYFRLYALKVPLTLKPGSTRAQLDAVMKKNVIAEGELMGRYKRPN